MAQAGTQWFSLSDVRLEDGPLRDAQQTDLHYLLALDPERLLAPFRREAGLPQPVPSYGNWESSGLDGHMGGHYLSALALMFASTGDEEVRQRLNHFVAELKRCQQANGNGYLGGIPGGAGAWAELAQGQLVVDSFSVNGRWVPWYNLHKIYAGLRDAWHHAGNADARDMLIALSDWALQLTAGLNDAQWRQMLRSEHGGMNEVLADVAELTGDAKYLALARHFSDPALLEPLLAGQDALTGLHANTQIPKVIGYERLAALSGDPAWHRAAQFFWQTVSGQRSVAIGGNSVKEHFHPAQNFQPMLDEVEGPETCNTYNMLKLTEALYLADGSAQARAAYSDFYERALYNHILSSQHPDTGGFVYFTPMRPNHYRVYSQVDQGMWCCVGSGLESHARYGQFIYAQDGDTLYVNLFVPSTLNWRAQGLHLTQATRFPDEGRTRLTVQEAGRFGLKIRYPGWVAPGGLRLRLNGQVIAVRGRPGEYVEIRRRWAAGDHVDVELPMRTRLEPMPGLSHYYAVLHGPIVLAAKTAPLPGERLKFLADDSRMGHIPQGPVCPQQAAPMFVSNTTDFVRGFKPVPGEPLTFTAPDLIQGGEGGHLRLIPFFRLHDSRYMLYWAHATPTELAGWRASTAQAEAERLALDAQTIDQVAPGEQQPESDHGFQGEGVETGLNGGARWRHASGWFSYVLNDPQQQARVLRLSLSRQDAGRRFDVYVNGQRLRQITLAAADDPAQAQAIYSLDLELPDALRQAAAGRWQVRFVAQPGSIAGGLYGLRLLR